MAWRVLAVGHVSHDQARDSWRNLSELHPLEEGKHAAESGMDLKSYAEAAGKGYDNLYKKLRAYSVLSVCHMANDQARDSWRNLSELHPLEEGKHAAESGMDLKSYAEAAGKVYKTLHFKAMAYRVMSSVLHVKIEDIRDSWRNLANLLDLHRNRLPHLDPASPWRAQRPGASPSPPAAS